MTIWTDDMDDDFLAPPVDNQPAAEAETEDDEQWTPLLGFPDEFNAVRVWADENGELERVRVSLNWREKLKDSSLERSFFICFLLMNTFHTDHSGPPELAPLPDPVVTEPLSWEYLGKVHREFEEISAKLEALPENPSRWVGTPVTGSDFEDGVIVQLDIHGLPVGVTFDPEWLDTPATSGEIARGVMAAYRRARKKHVPPTYEHSEYDRLSLQRDQIGRKLRGAWANGIRI